MVKTDTGLPGKGICHDLANWYRNEPGESSHFRGTFEKLQRMAETGGYEWAGVCEQAMHAVYQYPNWIRVFELLFDDDVRADLNLNPHVTELAPEPEPQEPDSIEFMGGGEGDEHRMLKEWVENHPEVVKEEYFGNPTCSEFHLKSGDWVDVAIFLPSGAIVAVEVKSRISNDADLERGVYQCIKYGAVIEAMGMKVVTVLITERERPSKLVDLSWTHNVRHIRVRRWGRGYGVVMP